MKAFFSGIGGFFDMLPGWLWAAVVAGVMAHSCGQGLKIEAGKLSLSQEQTKVATAELALSDRIKAEAQEVASAVQTARTEEQAKFKLQLEKTDALRKENAAARADLAAANNRVRDASDAAAAGFGCANLPGGTTDPGRAEDDPVARFKAAGRKLTDGVLQLLADADEAIRERNLCVSLRPVQK